MKFLFVTLCSAFIIGASSLSSDWTPEEEKIFDTLLDIDPASIPKYLNRYLEIKLNETCQNNLQIPYQEAMNRFDEVRNQDLTSLTVCTILKTKLPYIAEPVVKAFDNDCTTKILNGVGDYHLNAIIAVVDYICASPGVEILELAHPCTTNLHLSPTDCAENSKLTNGGYEDGLFMQPYKENACRGYRQVAPCLKGKIHEKCGLNITQQSLINFYDNVGLKACSN